MTIQEKAQLVQKLTNEIIEELASEEFANKSEEHKRKAGFAKMFSKNVVKHVDLLTKWTKGC